MLFPVFLSSSLWMIMMFRPFLFYSRSRSIPRPLAISLLCTLVLAAGRAQATAYSDGRSGFLFGIPPMTTGVAAAPTPCGMPSTGQTTLRFSTRLEQPPSVIAGGVYANAITFSNTATASGGTINLVGATPTITANANATISNALAGSGGLVSNGSATLTLGANTYTGNHHANAGVL